MDFQNAALSRRAERAERFFALSAGRGLLKGYAPISETPRSIAARKGLKNRGQDHPYFQGDDFRIFRLGKDVTV